LVFFADLLDLFPSKAETEMHDAADRDSGNVIAHMPFLAFIIKDGVIHGTVSDAEQSSHEAINGFRI